jgi:predicted TIM-barrel fold metal-dependent hydrolase
MIVDCDSHLFEPPDMWGRYADPADRDVALEITTDERGYSWLMCGERRLSLAEPHIPRKVEGIGEYRQRMLQGLPSNLDYPTFAAAYSDPKAILRHLDEVGYDAAVLFPNYGIIFERPLEDDLRAVLTNMCAWNRWVTDVAAEGGGRLHPVGHVSLRDGEWLESQLAALDAGGIRMAMMAPALVDGKPLSHPDLARAWSAFVDHGITPVFHVANQPRPFDDAWYGEDLVGGVNPMGTIFLWQAAALSITDLILGGVLERLPDLRIGVMELSARWVPLHLQLMDGSFRFTARFNGESAPIKMAPSDYFRRQVRVAAFPQEVPGGLLERGEDLFMACSDYPHTEGTNTPFDDYAEVGATRGEKTEGFFGENVRFLLRAS